MSVPCLARREDGRKIEGGLHGRFGTQSSSKTLGNRQNSTSWTSGVFRKPGKVRKQGWGRSTRAAAVAGVEAVCRWWRGR